MGEYVRLLEPITNGQQLERTKNIIKQFTAPSGLGPILQEYLLEKRENEDNWVGFFYKYRFHLKPESGVQKFYKLFNLNFTEPEWLAMESERSRLVLKY
jgi:Choline/Carnitine o-acyltransferase